MFEVSSGLTCSELAASRGHEKLAAILRSAAAQYTSWCMVSVGVRVLPFGGHLVRNAISVFCRSYRSRL